MAAVASTRSSQSALLGTAEDVLLCVDLSSEMGEPFGDTGSSTRLHMVKKSLASFARHKLSFNSRHRVGIAILVNEVSLALDFTSDLDLVLTMIDSLAEQASASSFDFRYLFEGFEKWFEVRLTNGDSPVSKAAATPHLHSSSNHHHHNRIMRAILVYGRSRALPTLTTAGKPPHIEHPRFFVDVLYVHRKVAKGNPEQLVCQEAYDWFIDTFESDVEAKSEYIVEVSGSASRLQQHMIMLLAHPAYRDEQEDFISKLGSAT